MALGPTYRLVYNGLSLDIWGVEVFRKEAIYAGPSYLYSRITLGVRAVINPAMNAYMPLGAGVVPAPAGFNRVGADTETTIKHRLLQPRKTLTLTIGGVEWLRSPVKAAYTTDANNGPTPLRAEVRWASGLRTLEVFFVVQTDINEYEEPWNQGNGAAASVLLANEWSQTEELDPRMHSTIVTEGTSVFRKDLLLDNQEIPDNFRRYLCPPVPTGYQRISILVEQYPDGVTFSWKTTDRQIYVSHAFRNITEIQVDMGIARHDPNSEIASIKSIPGAEGILESYFDPYVSDHGKKTKKWRTFVRSLGLVTRIATEVISTAALDYSIKLFGNPQCTRSQLLDAADAFSAYLDKKIGVDGATEDSQVRFSLTEPTLIFTKTVIKGPFFGGAAKIFSLKEARNYTDLTAGGLLKFPAEAQPQIYPADFNGWGSSRLYNVLSAALHDTGPAPLSTVGNIGRGRQDKRP